MKKDRATGKRTGGPRSCDSRDWLVPTGISLGINQERGLWSCREARDLGASSDQEGIRELQEGTSPGGPTEREVEPSKQERPPPLRVYPGGRQGVRGAPV